MQKIENDLINGLSLMINMCNQSGYQYTFNIENAITRMYKNEKIEPTMIYQRIEIAHCDVRKHKKTSTIID